MANKTVSIALTVYNPNPTFLEKQLKSLNAQTYKNIKLIVSDDSPNNDESIFNALKTNITKFEYELIRNKENLGVNKNIEKLTSICKSDFIAYCDQDDIWHPDKVRLNVDKIQTTNSALIYSDIEVIDEKDNLRFSSIREGRKRVKHKQGNDLWKYFIRMNSVTGCSMMVRSDVAKRAIPFPETEEYTWDQWLSIIGALSGRIGYIKAPLVKYRIHSNNQIGIKKMIGINNKQEYIEKRIKREIAGYDLLLSRIKHKGLRQHTQYMKELTAKRLNFLEGPSALSFFSNISLAFVDFKLFVMETGIGLDKLNDGKRIIEYIKRTNY